MAISGVLRAGCVQIRVTDMDAAVNHYTEVVGLIQTAEGDDGRDRGAGGRFRGSTGGRDDCQDEHEDGRCPHGAGGYGVAG